MNRINEFSLEPGPYADQGKRIIVVVDIINKFHNVSTNSLEELPDPIVVARDLIESPKDHERYGYPLSVFKQKFIKEK